MTKTKTKHRHILIVDDDADIRNTMRYALEVEGYPTVCAPNGQEALAILRQGGARTIGLIFLDLMMPVMTGWEFRAEQLRDPDLAAIPVVVLTGDATQQQTLQAAAYLVKPAELDVMLGLVERYC